MRFKIMTQRHKEVVDFDEPSIIEHLYKSIGVDIHKHYHANDTDSIKYPVRKLEKDYEPCIIYELNLEVLTPTEYDILKSKADAWDRHLCTFGGGGFE